MTPPRAGVVEERAVGDGPVDAGQVLVDDAPRAQGQMTHLGVAHDARRQTHGLAARLQKHVRILAPQRIPYRRVGQRDGVARAGGRVAPPVEDDERARRRRCAFVAGWSHLRYFSNLHDAGERRQLQARASHQHAVDVGLRHQFVDVVGPHAPAVEDAHLLGRFLPKQARDQLSARNAIASCAISGVAVLPVPMAQTGS